MFWKNLRTSLFYEKLLKSSPYRCHPRLNETCNEFMSRLWITKKDLDSVQTQAIYNITTRTRKRICIRIPPKRRSYTDSSPIVHIYTQKKIQTNMSMKRIKTRCYNKNEHPGWTACSKHRDIFKSSLAICLKTQVLNVRLLVPKNIKDTLDGENEIKNIMDDLQTRRELLARIFKRKMVFFGRAFSKKSNYNRANDLAGCLTVWPCGNRLLKPLMSSSPKSQVMFASTFSWIGDIFRILFLAFILFTLGPLCWIYEYACNELMQPMVVVWADWTLHPCMQYAPCRSKAVTNDYRQEYHHGCELWTLVRIILLSHYLNESEEKKEGACVNTKKWTRTFLDENIRVAEDRTTWRKRCCGAANVRTDDAN